MIVLDTTVVSEALKPQPNRHIVTWLEFLTDDVALTTITVAELLAGLQRLSPGRRRTSLTQQVEQALEPYLGTRAILTFDTEAARGYARIVAAREKAGRSAWPTRRSRPSAGATAPPAPPGTPAISRAPASS